MVFLPVRLRFTLAWVGGERDPFRFVFRLWGVPLLVFPGRKSRRSRWLAQKLFGWLDSLIGSKTGSEPTPKPSAPRKKRELPGLDFLIWAVGRGKSFLFLVTRRLELRCGGVDPAALGAFTGAMAIVQGMVGFGKLAWVPDFSPGPVRGSMDWEVSVSVWKIVSWIGETFVDKKRRGRRNASGFVPSSP